MIKEKETISGVVNDSFGWRRPAQILVVQQNNTHNYAELTRYFLAQNNIAEDNQAAIPLDQLIDAMNDPRLSEQSQRAATKLYEDISAVRAITPNIGLYAQGAAHCNAASKWHFDRNERTILAKYHGAATHIAPPESVLSQDDGISALSGFIQCDVSEDAKILTIKNGDIFSITGAHRFWGNPTAHRKAPIDDQPSLTLIAEPA